MLVSKYHKNKENMFNFKKTSKTNLKYEIHEKCNTHALCLFYYFSKLSRNKQVDC